MNLKILTNKKKVQSSVNNLKRKLFEIEHEKYLKSLNKFKNYKKQVSNYKDWEII